MVVYTDGSGLGNGQKGARAGLGVWWGESGRAYECNLHERVPGVEQTNNRGELLVRDATIDPLLGGSGGRESETLEPNDTYS